MNTLKDFEKTRTPLKKPGDEVPERVEVQKPIEKKKLIKPTLQIEEVKLNKELEGDNDMMELNNNFEQEIEFEDMDDMIDYDIDSDLEQPVQNNFNRVNNVQVPLNRKIQPRPNSEVIYEEEMGDDIEETTETIEEPKVEAKPVARTKATGGKTNKRNNPIKSTSPDDIVVPGQVTKREDLMELALNHLRSFNMEMSKESMSIVFKCLERAIEESVSRGGAVVFLGNQIQLKEKGQRVASVPKQNYDTLTFPYQAMQWSKLGKRTTVRGKYDQNTKIFTCQDGEQYQL